MGITRLRAVSIPVTDQGRAKDFYVNKLGFTLNADSEGPDGQRWVEVSPPGGGTSLTLVIWFPTMPAGSLRGLVLDCEDIQTTYDDLAARGVAFDGPIETAFWGTYATFADPDGNGWVLAEAGG